MRSHRLVRRHVRSRKTLLRTTTCVALFVAISIGIGPAWTAAAIGTAPNLGTATSFAVLAGSAVTNTGLSVIDGDLGVSPSLAVIGFPPGEINGTVHAGDAQAAQAQADTTAAYNSLAGQACDTVLTGTDLGGLTLTPGVYCFASSAQLTGTLTLNGLGDPDSVFVFQIGSSLTTASASSVALIGSATPCNVFWKAGASATLGTGTDFVGTLIALTSITATTDADVEGRLLARNGAVTLDDNTITNSVCPPRVRASSASSTDSSTTSTTAAPTTTTTAADGGQETTASGGPRGTTHGAPEPDGRTATGDPTGGGGSGTRHGIATGGGGRDTRHGDASTSLSRPNHPRTGPPDLGVAGAILLAAFIAVTLLSRSTRRTVA